MNTRVVCEFDVEVTCKGNLEYDQLIQPLVGCYSQKAPGAAVTDKQDAMAYTPTIVFGEGDPFSRSQTSYNVTVNGSQLSNHDQNLYLGPLSKCWISDASFQLRFAQCGGKLDAYDSRPVSGESAAFLDAVTTPATQVNTFKTYGFTSDSGVDQRIKNLYACVNSRGDVNATDDKIILRCQVPLWGGWTV